LHVFHYWMKYEIHPLSVTTSPLSSLSLSLSFSPSFARALFRSLRRVRSLSLSLSHPCSRALSLSPFFFFFLAARLFKLITSNYMVLHVSFISRYNTLVVVDSLASSRPPAYPAQVQLYSLRTTTDRACVVLHLICYIMISSRLPVLCCG